MIPTTLISLLGVAVVVLCSVVICGCVQGAYIFGHRDGKRS